jgi:hypothetical protein
MPDSKTDTILGIPIARFVTMVKPGINLLAGGVAAWLVAKVNIVGILGLDQVQLATQIAAGVTGLLTTALLQIGDIYWVKGHHIELENGGLTISADDVLESDALPPEAAGIPEDDPTRALPDQGDAGKP